MYYQLNNGHIVTTRDMHIAYEIITGEPIDTDSTKSVKKYDAWLKSNANIKRVIYDPNTLSIEELIAGNCILEAVKRYREKHCCSLSEARDAIYKLRDIKKIIVTNIDWDTDDDDDEEGNDDDTENEDKTRHLPPTKITIEINNNNRHLLEDLNGYADNLLDYLSDAYGFCIRGFNVETE